MKTVPPSAVSRQRSAKHQQTSSFIITPAQLAIDEAWLPYEFWATTTHVLMLARTRIISPLIRRKLLNALHTLERRSRSGQFTLSLEKGAHFSIEEAVTALAGRSAGGFLHTARSRNDQAVTLQRMAARTDLLHIHDSLDALSRLLLSSARQHIDTVMPGYTHMRPGKPTTLGQWYLAFSNMYERDLERLQEAYRQLNQSPLGAVESYGTRWPIDRTFTAACLGFDRVQRIPLDAVTSRGEFEVDVLTAYAQIAVHLSRQAQDLLLWSTEEYGFVRLGELAVRGHPATGSSVMPQKQNPDLLELLRAESIGVISTSNALLNLLRGLPSSYQRDSRESRTLLLEGSRRVTSMVAMMRYVVPALAWRTDRMHSVVLASFSMAPELADLLSERARIPFRTSYLIVGSLVDRCRRMASSLTSIRDEDIVRAAAEYGHAIKPKDLAGWNDPHTAVRARRHIGGTAPATMAQAAQESLRLLAAATRWRVSAQARLQRAHQRVMHAKQMSPS